MGGYARLLGVRYWPDVQPLRSALLQFALIGATETVLLGSTRFDIDSFRHRRDGPPPGPESPKDFQLTSRPARSHKGHGKRIDVTFIQVNESRKSD